MFIEERLQGIDSKEIGIWHGRVTGERGILKVLMEFVGRGSTEGVNGGVGGLLAGKPCE